MRPTKTKRIIVFVVMFTLFLTALASTPAARADDNRAPDLPAACSDLQAPAGNKVISHVYARGVQIYRWDGSAWVFVAPVATLFADANYHGQVGIHYVTPWKTAAGRQRPVMRCPPSRMRRGPWLQLAVSAAWDLQLGDLGSAG
jgi:hypothetical protein